MKIKLTIMLTLALSIQAYANSATWDLNPTSDHWDMPENWTPDTVPDGLDDDATFSQSGATSIQITAGIKVDQLIFAPGADQFTITVHARRLFSIFNGIVNDSGMSQTLVARADPGGKSGTISFFNGSSPGTMMTIITEGNSVANLGNGGLVNFQADSNAAGGTFVNQGASVDAGFGGRIIFAFSSSAANSTITNEPGTVAGAIGGFTSFDKNTSAGNAVIIAEGATVPNALSGLISLADGADAGAASLIATGGSNGGGGGRIFLGAGGGTCRIELLGNSHLEVAPERDFDLTIGSLEGEGTATVSGRTAGSTLIIGSNNLSTTFSGLIQDGDKSGSLGKIGSGTLTLSGANTYTDGTAVTSGILLVSNTTGSGTGTGAVNVEAGTLGGSGVIAGAVTVGTNTGEQAFLAPSKGTKKPATLTIQSALTLNDDSTYIYQLNTKRAVSDEVIANGVTVDSGAKFSFRPRGNNALSTGRVFTVINNTAATPIAGTFHNLTEGKILTVNGSNLRASYSGGDGNDLTLTVVP